MGSQADPGRRGQVLVVAGLVLVATALWGGILRDLQHERREAMAAASRVGASLARAIGAHFVKPDRHCPYCFPRWVLWA